MPTLWIKFRFGSLDLNAGQPATSPCLYEGEDVCRIQLKLLLPGTPISYVYHRLVVEDAPRLPVCHSPASFVFFVIWLFGMQRNIDVNIVYVSVLWQLAAHETWQLLFSSVRVDAAETFYCAT